MLGVVVHALIVYDWVLPCDYHEQIQRYSGTGGSAPALVAVAGRNANSCSSINIRFLRLPATTSIVCSSPSGEEQQEMQGGIAARCRDVASGQRQKHLLFSVRFFEILFCLIVGFTFVVIPTQELVVLFNGEVALAL